MAPIAGLPGAARPRVPPELWRAAERRLRRVAPLCAALCTTGCLGGWRVGSGLTVDTAGQVGAQATVGGFFGLGGEHSGGVTVGVEGGSGMALNPVEGRIFASPGIDYVRPGDEYCWRAGVRTSFQGAAPAPAQGRFELGAAAAVAVLRTVDDAHESGGEKWGGAWDSYLGLGAELRAGILTPEEDTNGGESDRPRVRGTLGLGFVIEREVFSGL
jgi:hypothetical protein